MLKVHSYAITFEEFPDEVTLALNISNCPGMCDGCSEPWLLEDVGTPLTNEYIQQLIDENPDVTVFGLMGGDSDHKDVARIADYVHSHSKLKVGIYSGREFLNYDLMSHLDLYKIGRWIMPKGPKEDWWRTNCGPLQLPYSNQLLFEKVGNLFMNVTYKFRKHPVNDPSRFIIGYEEPNKDEKKEEVK